MTEDSSPVPVNPSPQPAAEEPASGLEPLVNASAGDSGNATAEPSEAVVGEAVFLERESSAVPSPESAAPLTVSSPVENGETLPPRRFFTLDPRSVRVEQFAGLILFAGFVIAVIFGLGISFVAIDELVWIWWAIAAALACAAGLLLVFVLVWPGIEFRYARWTWDEDGLEIHRGVFWQHRITIPISRIQHVDVSQGPLQRQFGLGKVTVHTAGTQHAAIELSGIAYEAAIWLREQIIAGQGAPDAV